MTGEAGKEFIAHCPDCGQQWVAAILPMTIETFARVAGSACCPRGCQAKVLCGPAPVSPA